MKAPTGLLVVFLVVVLVVSLAIKVHAATYPMSATGYSKCYIDSSNKPMPNVHVKLMDDDSAVDDQVAATRTSSSGYFSMSGQGSDLIGTPDPKIRVELEYIGACGCIRVKD